MNDRWVEWNEGRPGHSLPCGFDVDLAIGRQHPKDHAVSPSFFEYSDVFLHDLDLRFRV